MPKPYSPRKLTPQQLKRLQAYISAQPILTHQTFLAKWDISRELTSEICRVHFRTLNSWFAQADVHQSCKKYHFWHLTFADIILERFDELPDFLQLLLCPVDKDF